MCLMTLFKVKKLEYFFSHVEYLIKVKQTQFYPKIPWLKEWKKDKKTVYYRENFIIGKK